MFGEPVAHVCLDQYVDEPGCYLREVRPRQRDVGYAAEQLGLRPTTLETRMAKLGLQRPKTA